ncbi:MAG: hypothetical protein HYT39_00210 [Candidatus Sungbacteria bacterium]|nr:hypothetical protein [Candidatus Sungbacteria bacterium]
MRSFTITLFIVVIMALGLPTLAHGDQVSFEDLGGEPLILPTSPFYFLKEMRRALTRTFAFTAERKAKVELELARERLAEIKKLTEKSPEAKEALQKAEVKYSENFEKLKQNIASLGDKNKNTEDLIEKLGDIAEKHQAVFEEVKTAADISDQELESIDKTLKETLNEAAKFDAQAAKKSFGKLKSFVHEGEFDELGKGLDDGELQDDIDNAFKELKDLYEEADSNNKNAASPTKPEHPAEIKKGEPENVCINLFEPVCGLDGKTYSNSCFAGKAGVGVKSKGECNVSVPPAAESSPAPSPVSGVSTFIRGFAFEKEIRVPVGGTVTWTNADGVGHTVTADDNSFSSDLLSGGVSFSFTFNQRGKFTYFCKPHPWMTGVVIVE